MAFVDQGLSSRKAVSVTGVILVHLAIGYALLTGLAAKVIPREEFKTWWLPIPPIKPPPPLPKTKPSAPIDRFKAEVPLPPGPVSGPPLTWDPVPAEPVHPIAQPEPLRLSRLPQAKGDHASWVTPDDYPPGAIRDGEEGRVAISVRIGTDGRVSACTVTASSGHALLDEATCRFYSRRARFAPALAADGTPTESSYVDRVRWQLPEQ